MKWLVKVTKTTTDPFTNHQSTSSQHHIYKTESGARRKIQKVIQDDPKAVCELYQQIPGSFTQEQLFGSQSPLWDY